MIYEESAAHLTEIYHQANQSLHNLVGNNWSTMQMWVPYLNDMTDENLIKQYIEKLQKEAGFTEFYFISREGCLALWCRIWKIWCYLFRFSC